MKSTNATPENKSYKTVRKRISSIRPSPENSTIYDGIDPDDRFHIENQKLDDSIKKHGLHEPLVLTQDGYIVSGHRRYGSLKRIGQAIAPCRVLQVRRDEMTTDDYVALLREHNRQRHKTIAEQVREELVDVDPHEAHESLLRQRNKSINASIINGVGSLAIEGRKKRHGISAAKAEHVRHIMQVVFDDRRDYWPLSVRGVHYGLLNYMFFRNTSRRLRYQNDTNSYQATSDLITRLRLTGEIPWIAFDDVTRPLTEYRAFSDVRQFVRQERENLFCGYWRDLLQSQPNHIEIVCEKNTIYHIATRVSKKYMIPTSSGRGFNSIDPWHDLAERYELSGKERLIVIVLSDFDPEGEMIPHVGGRTLRDDFGIERVSIIKAGVTREQIEQNDLPQQNFAKEESSNYQWFVERQAGDNSVYELEALPPEALLDDLERVVQSVLDIDLYNAEVQREKEEAAYLKTARKKLVEAMEGLG